MAEKRIVMQVKVLWVTNDDDETVKKVMAALDESDTPSPLDFVQMALVQGAPYVNFTDLGIDGGYFEVRVEGPVKWGVAYDDTAAGD